MKKPLKEMLKKIGGKHLLKEYNDDVAEYRKFEDAIYATWGWEGKNEIPIESSDGDDLGKINQKFKGSDPDDEKQLKIDSKKYIQLMKKEFPKIEKKLLKY